MYILWIYILLVLLLGNIVLIFVFVIPIFIFLISPLFKLKRLSINSNTIQYRKGKDNLFTINWVHFDNIKLNENYFGPSSNLPFKDSEIILQRLDFFSEKESKTLNLDSTGMKNKKRDEFIINLKKFTILMKKNFIAKNLTIK